MGGTASKVQKSTGCPCPFRFFNLIRIDRTRNLGHPVHALLEEREDDFVIL